MNIKYVLKKINNKKLHIHNSKNNKKYSLHDTFFIKIQILINTSYNNKLI